jgi:HK97 gp10 family phage protein
MIIIIRLRLFGVRETNNKMPLVTIDLTAVISRFGKAPTNLQEGITQAIDQLLQGGLTIATSRVPVDTGHLKSTIKVDKTSELMGSIDASAEYAGFVERGTSRMRAQPYMAPAFEQIKRDAPEAIRNAVVKALSG